MDAAKRGTSKVPSLPPPCPKSPPEYPDLYGKRRELAKVQMLEREIDFLEGASESVQAVGFSFMTAEEVRRHSVKQITNPNLLDVLEEAATWRENLDQLYKSSSQSFRVVVHGSKHSADQFERLLKEMCADEDEGLIIESAVKGIPKPGALENGPYDYTRSGNPTRDALESLWDYTNVVMNFLCDPNPLGGSRSSSFDWLQYFDVVITGSLLWIPSGVWPGERKAERQLFRGIGTFVVYFVD